MPPSKGKGEEKHLCVPSAAALELKLCKCIGSLIAQLVGLQVLKSQSKASQIPAMLADKLAEALRALD